MAAGLITIDIDDSAFTELNLGYPGASSANMFDNQEFIIYNSNQTDNKTGIESNINTYYSIY